LIEYQYLYTLKKITMRTSRRFLNRPIQTQQTETAEPFFSPAQPSAVQTKAEESFFAPAASDTIQTKLSVNAPGDKHEQEADSMADHVVQRMSAPDKEKDKVHRKAAPEKEKDKLQKKSQGQDEEEKGKIQRMSAPDKEKDKNKVQKKSIGHTEEDKDKVHRKAAPDKEKDKLQRKCADCEKEEHGQVQRKADGGGTAPSGVTHQIESSKGNGSQLSDDTRAQMESSFGTDFSNVRIHNNSESAEMNDALHAQAFTHGSDIYFNEGKYNPQNTEGSRLLAHELTHVVQQGENIKRKCNDKTKKWDFEFDGCSVPSFVASIIGAADKDNPAGGKDTQFGLLKNLDGPCDKHDRCYQTCNSSPDSKDKCDDNMFSNMVAVCNASTESKPIKEKCHKFAQLYFKGLKAFGGNAFSERQDQVCSCGEKKKEILK
jgi:Domain of unknown function (DUF4157)